MLLQIAFTATCRAGVLIYPQEAMQATSTLTTRVFIASRETSLLLFAKGWLFRDEPSLRKHADLLRNYFSPVDKHAADISRLIEKARKDCDLLVGIHIRQGDYKNWLDGKALLFHR